MRFRAALIASAVVLCIAAADADADLRVDGHGSGHGIGMSQYGAYGYALKTRHSYRYILRHYYPGTKVQRTRSHNIRVLTTGASRYRPRRRRSACTSCCSAPSRTWW